MGVAVVIYGGSCENADSGGDMYSRNPALLYGGLGLVGDMVPMRGPEADPAIWGFRSALMDSDTMLLISVSVCVSFYL